MDISQVQQQKDGRAHAMTRLQGRASLHEQLAATQRSIQVGVQSARNFVKQNPLACLAGATAAGFFAAALMNRVLKEE